MSINTPVSRTTVEFKKSNRYSNGRDRLNVPQRGDVPTVTSTPTQPSALPKPPRTTRTTKKANVSHARTFFFKRKTIIIGSSILIVLAILITGVSIHNASIAKNVAKDTTNKIIQTTGYQTILPDGKTINSLGGWERISPPNSDPVYAYTDKIDGTSVSVSEQPLPKTFEGDAESQVAELAKKFNATTKITADDTIVYLGTSAKGPQSAIFIKINLLVLIKSQSKISDDAWVKYIKSLNA